MNNWQSVLSSTRFDFEGGDSTNGTSISLFEIFKLSIAFLSSFALSNINDTFTFNICHPCLMCYSFDVVHCCDLSQENSACNNNNNNNNKSLFTTTVIKI